MRRRRTTTMPCQIDGRLDQGLLCVCTVCPANVTSCKRREANLFGPPSSEESGGDKKALDCLLFQVYSLCENSKRTVPIFGHPVDTAPLLHSIAGFFLFPVVVPMAACCLVTNGPFIAEGA